MADRQDSKVSRWDVFVELLRVLKDIAWTPVKPLAALAFFSAVIALLLWTPECDSQEAAKRSVEAIESAGFYVHPFARTPNEACEEEYRWSEANVGIWEEPPEFYLRTKDGSRQYFDPDTSDWEPLTEEKVVA